MDTTETDLMPETGENAGAVVAIKPRSRQEKLKVRGVDAVDLDLADATGRPLFQRLAYPPRLSFNGLLVTLLATVFLVLIGFVVLPLPSPLNLGSQVTSYDQLQMMRYTLQLPAMLFVAAILGPFMGMAAVFLYLATGLLFYPIFANGGGLHYLQEPGFGYLLGAFVAAVSLGQTFHRSFQKEEKENCSLKLLRQVLVSVLLIHGVGLLYLVGLGLTHQIPLQVLPGWLLRLSVEPFGYDLVATAVLLGLVRQFRLLLLFVLY